MLLATFNLFFYQHQTHMSSSFGLEHIDGCVNSGLPRRVKNFDSVSLLPGADGKRDSWCEID